MKRKVTAGLFFVSMVLGVVGVTDGAQADCSEAERQKMTQQIIGTWAMQYANGEKSCITLRYERDGRLIQSSRDCRNGSTGSSTKRWLINNSCELVQKGQNESDKPYGLHFDEGGKVLTVDAISGPIKLTRK